MPSTVYVRATPTALAAAATTNDGEDGVSRVTCVAAVETFQTHEHVDRCRTQAGDVNRAAAETARAVYRPAFDIRIVGHRSHVAR